MVSAADVWGEVKIPHISFLSQTSLRRVKPTWGDGRKSRPKRARAQNRSARYGLTSMFGIGPVIMPVMIRPVIGPATMPVCP